MFWMQEQATPAGRSVRLAGTGPEDTRLVRSRVEGPLAAMTPLCGPMARVRTVTKGASGVLLAQSDVPGDFYDIHLVYGDGRPMQILFSAQDDAAVVALWRRTALDLGLPLMVARQDGVVIQPYEHCGPVALGAFRYRRRTALMRNRRPRFLQRRKTTCLPDRPVVHRDREMTSQA